MLRRRNHLVQHAVDSITNLVLVLERFEVDVTRVVINRLEQHEVEQFLDRTRLRQMLHLVEIDALPAILKL